MKMLKISKMLLGGFLTALVFAGCDKPNAAPVAKFTFTPTSGPMDTVFTFDASGSYDDHDCSCSLEVRWDWNADGTWDTGFSTEKTAAHRFKEFADNTVMLEVKDTKGLTASVTKTVSVASAAVITGMDPRMCMCCGGWWIRIDSDTLRFFDYPAASAPILDNPVFPINVRVKWVKKSPRCMGDEIVLLELARE